MYKNDYTITLHNSLSVSLSLLGKQNILILLPEILRAIIPARRKLLNIDFSLGRRACCAVARSLAGLVWSLREPGFD